jgi:hypothetical protein
MTIGLSNAWMPFGISDDFDIKMIALLGLSAFGCRNTFFGQAINDKDHYLNIRH